MHLSPFTHYIQQEEPTAAWGSRAGTGYLKAGAEWESAVPTASKGCLVGFVVLGLAGIRQEAVGELSQSNREFGAVGSLVCQSQGAWHRFVALVRPQYPAQ